MEERVIVVTGASRGNGEAISKLLSSEPANVIIGVDLEECNFQNSGLFAKYLMLDVSDAESSRIALSIATDLSKNVYLVNNAGISRPNSGTYLLEDFEETLSVNLTSPFVWLEYYGELVADKKILKGGVVNICSLASHRAFPGNPAYIASKHGLLGLTKYYAKTLGGHGIRVNSVSPGYIKTGMTSVSLSDNERRELISNHSMLGRWGEPNEVAEAVRFLLSNQSSFITGADIAVDGGWLSNGMYTK
jgi:NAD(P)-dependent dehydrogenase (short-subunit alcohol dehydrogenase family)